jgi:transcriptional regulator with XRE-family HTH domain
MSPLTEYREKLNLTQEELATKSGISVRTIQRIESGTKPKGYTLETLSKVLGISKDELLTEQNVSLKSSKQLIKYINLSSILLLTVPFGSIIMPLIIMYWKKEFNTLSKQIVSIQILWTLATIILILASSFLKNILSFSNQLTALTILFSLVVNLYIILRNTSEIEKNEKLHIKLNFSFI